MFSGGYVEAKIFEFEDKMGKVLQVLDGSPRDLAAMIDSKLKATGTSITIAMIKYPRFDDYKKFVPQNNFVSMSDKVPGMIQECFPPPAIKSKDSRGKAIEEEPVQQQAPSPLHIHNIEIHINPKLDSEVEDIVRRSYVCKEVDSKGMKRDPKNISVDITERKIAVKCHNSWKTICGHAHYATLKDPTPYGVSYADDSMAFGDFVTSEYIAIVFELIYEVVVQGG